MSHAKYDTLHWMQEISYNLLHFKATDSRAILMQRTDELVGKYVEQADPLRDTIRQYLLSGVAGHRARRTHCHGCLAAVDRPADASARRGRSRRQRIAGQF